MKKIILFVIITGQLVLGQNKTVLTENLNQDMNLAFTQTNSSYDTDNSNSLAVKRKPGLAALYSAAIPGAGQVYNKQYWKTAIFALVEIAAITTTYLYNKKGDDQTAYFHQYADAHWAVTRYAKWTEVHATEINSNVDPSQYNVFNSDGSVNWRELNRLELAIGSYYSHQLAPYGEQQYYEMIGKYTQFNVGWDDFGDENTPYHYGDPVTPHFAYYSHQRGLANDYYDVAKWGYITILTNHILSAVEAAWSAHKHNRSLKVRMSMNRFNSGYSVVYYPQINFNYRF